MFIRSVSQVLCDLGREDLDNIAKIDALYEKVLGITENYDKKNKQYLVELYNCIGDELHKIVDAEEHLHIYSFNQPKENHGQVSRVISKLRNIDTPNIEFLYYIQKSFEMLFNFAFDEGIKERKNYFEIQTPVTFPVQNYAVHKLPDMDSLLHNSVVCVMLRGALLPSLIMAKEIQEYSSIGYVPDFALFRIARNDNKDEANMEYILREHASFFDPEQLDGKDLFFPDPMNATGGSILTVLEYLKEQGVRPKSVRLFHTITSLKGALQLLRSNHKVDVYSLWVDPSLNEKAYIMPGLGDAGDRLNGEDTSVAPRNIIQLIAHYGQSICQLYRAQIHKMEERILGKI